MQNNFPFYFTSPFFSNDITQTVTLPLQTYDLIILRLNLQNQEIERLKKENEQLRTHNQQLQKENEARKQKQSKVLMPQNSPETVCKKKKPQKTFYCDYQKCDRAYSSTLALNLHIKTKHNGGTKKERDAYAKLIAMAELNGQPIPAIKFNFPKNYINSFKKKLLNENLVNTNQNNCQKQNSGNESHSLQ